MLSLERKSDRSDSLVLRLYQNWRQGVSTQLPPVRPLRRGAGAGALAFSLPQPGQLKGSPGHGRGVCLAR